MVTPPPRLGYYVCPRSKDFDCPLGKRSESKVPGSLGIEREWDIVNSSEMKPDVLAVWRVAPFFPLWFRFFDNRGEFLGRREKKGCVR